MFGILKIKPNVISFVAQCKGELGTSLEQYFRKSGILFYLNFFVNKLIIRPRKHSEAFKND